MSDVRAKVVRLESARAARARRTSGQTPLDPERQCMACGRHVVPEGIARLECSQCNSQQFSVLAGPPMTFLCAGCGGTLTPATIAPS